MWRQLLAVFELVGCLSTFVGGFAAWAWFERKTRQHVLSEAGVPDVG